MNKTKESYCNNFIKILKKNLKINLKDKLNKLKKLK